VARDTVIGIEGSSSYGGAVGRTLLATGSTVRKVPQQLSHRRRGAVPGVEGMELDGLRIAYRRAGIGPR